MIDWPVISEVLDTPFAQAINETFNDPHYSKVVLKY